MPGSANLPAALGRILDGAREAVRRAPSHELPPAVRQGVYGTMEAAAGARGVRARLAVLAARRVLPAWEAAWPGDPTAGRLLALGEGVLAESVDPREARAAADAAWQTLEVLGADVEPARARGFYAGTAAAKALLEALGRDPFAGVTIDDRTSDDALDVWASDAAVWAAHAAAGAPWDATSDAAERWAFWEWWLGPAVREAWGA
jgi:hypothetical protein